MMVGTVGLVVDPVTISIAGAVVTDPAALSMAAV
jgi:hypothetical protein